MIHAVGAPLQIGGGFRSFESIAEWIDLGAGLGDDLAIDRYPALQDEGVRGATAADAAIGEMTVESDHGEPC